MKHLQFPFFFAGVICLHLVLSHYPSATGWKSVSKGRDVATSAVPVIYYDTISPSIAQLKWKCVSGEIRIRKVEIKTEEGVNHSFEVNPAVLHAGISTQPMDLSLVKGKLRSVAIWYDSSSRPSNNSQAQVQMLGMVDGGQVP